MSERRRTILAALASSPENAGATRKSTNALERGHFVLSTVLALAALFDFSLETLFRLPKWPLPAHPHTAGAFLALARVLRDPMPHDSRRPLLRAIRCASSVALGYTLAR